MMSKMLLTPIPYTLLCLFPEEPGASLSVVCSYNLVLFDKGVPFLTPDLYCLYGFCAGFCGESSDTLLVMVVGVDVLSMRCILDQTWRMLV